MPLSTLNWYNEPDAKQSLTSTTVFFLQRIKPICKENFFSKKINEYIFKLLPENLRNVGLNCEKSCILQSKKFYVIKRRSIKRLLLSFY